MSRLALESNLRFMVGNLVGRSFERRRLGYGFMIALGILFCYQKKRLRLELNKNASRLNRNANGLIALARLRELGEDQIHYEYKN